MEIEYNLSDGDELPVRDEEKIETLVPEVTNTTLLQALDAVGEAVAKVERLRVLFSTSRQKDGLPHLYLARVRLEEAQMYLDTYINGRVLKMQVKVTLPDGKGENWRVVPERVSPETVEAVKRYVRKATGPKKKGKRK